MATVGECDRALAVETEARSRWARGCSA